MFDPNHVINLINRAQLGDLEAQTELAKSALVELNRALKNLDSYRRIFDPYFSNFETTNMKIVDFNRLKAFMALTTSTSDAEALTALRMANKLLAGYGIDWERVLNRTVTVVNEVEPAPEEELPSHKTAARQARDIETAFSDVFRGELTGSFENFMCSLREQWENKKYLTPDQRSALFKAQARANGRQ